MKFGKKVNHGAQTTQTQKLVSQLREMVDGKQVITTQAARTVLSLESAQESMIQDLNRVNNELRTSLESIAANLGLESVLTEAQKDAASLAGILASDFRSHLAQKIEFNNISTESVGVVQPIAVDDAMSARSFGLEAYDERENRNAVVYSIAYNMQSARQDEFGETFFPTIVTTPDSVGFGITVNLMMVYDGYERKITGSFEDFKKKNIIRAVADSTILKKEQTRAVPVVRQQSADKFIDAGIIAPTAILLDGESITTAPLKIGKKNDLLALSQTDTLLAAGVMDMTDTLDPYVNLANVYVTVGADVLSFNVSNLPLSNFTYSTQNNYRVMTLNFATTSVLINEHTKNVDGSNLVTLAAVATNHLTVRMALTLTGTVNIETGECNVFGNVIEVYTVQDTNGNLLDLSASPSAGIVTAVSTGTPASGQTPAVAAAAIAGYDLTAYRTNANRRQRGQLIDVTRYTQLYNVPLRSPISTIHPVNSDGTTDASDVQALITGTRIRTSNEAVTALINTAATLSQYVSAADLVGVGPDIMGVGRFFVKPSYFSENIDMNQITDSLKSHERAADLQAALVNKIRDYAFQMYRNSEYKAAADALNGGVSPVPVVTIGTDPVLARYLNVTGDLRTLGGEFDVRIVSSLDYRVAGKIFITFGVFNEERNVAPNPLNFGNMIWAPELVLTASISRQGAISKETVVQPRYLFVTHMPILTVLTVTNVPEVLNKVAINFHSM